MGWSPSWSRRQTRRLLWGLGLVVLLCVLTFCWQAWRAGSALVDAADQGRSLQSQLVQGQLGRAQRTAKQLADSTGRAADHTDGPLWGIAAHLPLIGPNVRAVRTSSTALHTLAEHSLPTLLGLAGAAEQGRLLPHHGRMDLGEVSRWAPEVRRAAAAAHEPARRLARVDASELFFPIADFVGPVQGLVATADKALDSTADALTVLPSMMGAHGRRTFLLLIQNNAEIRSTGGMPGSWALLHADHGRVRMGRQGSAGDLGTLARPPVPLRPAERSLYGGLGTDLRDVTATPDFPRSARLAAGIIRQRLGVRVDGVVSIDPVALGYLLRGLGPVRVPPRNTRLTSANAAVTLLNSTYRFLPTAQGQDDFNQAAARAVFDAMVAGRGNELSMVDGLVRSVRERRLLAWSRHPRVARVISGNQLSGELVGDGGSTPHVGVYLDDAAGSKMEFYLRQHEQVVAKRCRAGTQRLAVSVELHSIAPNDITDYPSFVTGFGIYAPRGVISLNAWLFAPYGGSIDSLRVDGRPVTVAGGTQKGRQVATVPVTLAPGRSHTLTAVMTTGRGQTGDPVLTTTPGIESRPDPITGSSAC